MSFASRVDFEYHFIRKCKEMFVASESWVPILNVIVCVLFVVCFVRGWRHGLIRMLLSLVSMIASLYLAWVLSPNLGKTVSLWPKNMTPMQDTLFASNVYEVINHIAWFFVLFIVLRIVFFVLDKISKGMMHVPVLKEFMGILGGVLGILEAVIWSVLLTFLLSLPIYTNGAEIAQKSFLGTIENGCSVVLSDFKPFKDTKDLLELISDASEVAKEQQGLFQSFFEQCGE